MLIESPKARPLDPPQPTSLTGVSESRATPDSRVAGGRTMRWTEEKRIVPQFEPQIGKTHVLGKVRRATDGSTINNNWGGAVLNGSWTKASGFWVIPNVTKNVMPQGSQISGWTSSSWVGLDGASGSNDVLQAGVQQSVDKHGNPSYVAWYEWYAPSLPGSPKYLSQTNIPNFNVSPGQEVFCSAQYIGSGWGTNDLIALGGGIGPAPGSALDGYWGSDSSQHVNFIGTDGHLHEMYTNPKIAHWQNNDLTALGGGVQPAPGSRLDGYWGSDGSQHVNFIGTDGHLCEMYTNPQIAHWQNNDLTVFAGSTGTSPAPGTAVDGYWGSDGSQHVNFIGTDGHLREMYTQTF
jgi:hypothetical protein